MCLHNLSKNFKVTRKFGYKWLYKNTNDGGIYYSPIYNSGMGGFSEFGKWYVDNNRLPFIYTNSGVRYKPGFHVYLTKKDALKSELSNWFGCVLVKVEFDDFITGLGDGMSSKNSRQVVAQKIHLIKEVV